MEIKTVMQEIYEGNKKKGFWDEPRNTGELLMLVTSELAEALEADREGRHSELGFDAKVVLMKEDDIPFNQIFKDVIKDGFQDEIADAVIRLFDLSAGLGIDLEWHIKAKMRYNSLRPHKHGKKY